MSLVHQRRMAYADPPYPGQAKKHYKDRSDYAGEVDHEVLISRLTAYPDGWALSTSSPALRDVLALCPPDVRVAAWVKPFAVFKKGVDPAYAWEPVIFHSTRKWSREQLTCRDWVAAPITMQKGLTGAKSGAFCYWLFELLGMQPEDELDDLFPGSGAVSEAWDAYRAQMRMVA